MSVQGYTVLLAGHAPQHTADCLPPPQVLPAGDGHGEQVGPEAHFTRQGLPGGRHSVGMALQP